MADLKAIRDALGDAIEMLDGLQVQRRPGGIVNPPSVVIEPGEVDFAQSMRRGTEKWDMLARVLISTTFNEAAQQQRDAFFGGAHDLKDAIESHVPLQDGTAAQGVFVRAARKFDAWQYQGASYLGVEFSIDVYA